MFLKGSEHMKMTYTVRNKPPIRIIFISFPIGINPEYYPNRETGFSVSGVDPDYYAHSSDILSL